MKPGFYMLAKHGPWNHHVRVRNIQASNEADAWLVSQGKKYIEDFEVLLENIQHKTSKQITGSWQLYPQPILFFNDASLASYVKLTWS